MRLSFHHFCKMRKGFQNWREGQGKQIVWESNFTSYIPPNFKQEIETFKFCSYYPVRKAEAMYRVYQGPIL